VEVMERYHNGSVMSTAGSAPLSWGERGNSNIVPGWRSRRKSRTGGSAFEPSYIKKNYAYFEGDEARKVAQGRGG
jgi:hypothetical protein